MCACWWIWINEEVFKDSFTFSCLKQKKMFMFRVLGDDLDGRCKEGHVFLQVLLRKHLAYSNDRLFGGSCTVRCIIGCVQLQ